MKIGKSTKAMACVAKRVLDNTMVTPNLHAEPSSLCQQKPVPCTLTKSEFDGYIFFHIIMQPQKSLGHHIAGSSYKY